MVQQTTSIELDDIPIFDLFSAETVPELDSEISSVEDESVFGTMEAELPIDIFSSQIPGKSVDIDSVQSAIAKEMAALSAEAREKAYMDMHGVPDAPHESSELIQQSLKELQNEIGNIRHKDAYNLAWNTDRTYVEDEEFRLLFLRADEMNARLAARRLVRHFQLKLDLFGPELLAKTITQDDLNKEDMEALYSGRGRFLPSKDRAGRTINLSIAGQRCTNEAVLRRAFYNVMSNPHLETSSERGVVAVVYALGEQAFPTPNPELKWKMPKLQEALPVRFVAVHLCQDRSLQNSLFATVMSAFNTFTRIRVRTHCGSHDEVMASLQGYGIEPGSLPINETGQTTDLEEYRQNLILQRARERVRYPRRSRIYVPSRFDVLFGKGTPYQDHIGNKRFRALVAEQRGKYEKSARGEKFGVAQAIVDSVIQNTGMFLKPDVGTWICVDNNAARSKVSCTFRTMKMMSRS